MQQITITGYLSRDAEVRTTQKGDSIANWNVPVNQGFGDNKTTNWFRVSIWGKRSEYAGKARKGDFVTVIGDLEIGEYEGKPQYNIRATDFQAVRPAPRDDAGDAPTGNGFSGSGPRGGRGDQGGFADDLDDDIPFICNQSIF